MGDFLGEEALELCVESSGLVGVSGRSPTCTNRNWHQAALCVYRQADGLAWLLGSMIQKQLEGGEAHVCPPGEGLPSSHEDPGGFQDDSGS